MIWPVVTLDELKSPEPRAITDGPFGSNLARQHYTDSGPRVVRLQNIGDGYFVDAKAHISQAHFEALRAHEVLPGDLLVASLGDTLPRACLAPPTLGPAIVKADCIRVRLSPEVDPRWVMYALQSPRVRRWADKHRHGVGRPRLGLKVIRQIPVPFPPRTEQRRIVEILEDHLSRLDAGDGLIRRSEQAGEAMLLSLLSVERRALDASAPTICIGDLAETTLGKMLDSKRQTGEPTPYLRNINVRWGRFNLSDLQSTLLTPRDRERLRLEAGDVLVCEGGEPGRCAVWTSSGDDIAFQKALHRVRVKDHAELSPEYLALMLRESIQSKRADHLFTGTTIKHLPQEKLRTIRLQVPMLSEQERIVGAAEAVQQSTDRLRSELRQASQRSTQLRRAVLAAAFSGSLTGHRTDDEVIEELAQ